MMRYSRVDSRFLYERILRLNRMYLEFIRRGLSKIYHQFILHWYGYAKRVFHYGLIPGVYMYTLWREDEFTLNPVRLARVLLL